MSSSSDSGELLAAMRRNVSTGRAGLHELMGGHVEVDSFGCRVVDARGRELLDCGGYGVFLLGHRHPRVVEAVRAQLDRHPLSTRVLAEPRLVEAAGKLAAVAPAGLEYVLFVNSGAEATEAAIKIARTCGRHRLVSMTGGFHGKTMGALSVTSSPLYRDPFKPLLPNVTQVQFGSAAALEAVLLEDGASQCVILEPVLAEGGVVLPPDGFLRDAERICRRYGAFLVLDEIQTGLGRLGTWWGADREGVVPDVLLSGKALSGGVVPVAAAIATPEAYAAMSRDPFLHTSTFAGSPLAMAAAHAALVAIEEEEIVPRAEALGTLLLERIRAITALDSSALVRDVRGLGLLIGIEFTSAEWAAEMMLELLKRRVIVNHSLNDQRVVRLTPPAIMSEFEVEWLLEAIEDSAEAIRSRAELTLPEGCVNA